MRFLHLSILLCLFCFGFLSSSAQKETAHWFLSGSRVTVTPAGIVNTSPSGMSFDFYPRSGSTSVADTAGNLLFAFDGGKVIDKNLSAMPALKDVYLQGQDKVLAAKVPGSNRYYLFYVSRNRNEVNTSWTLKYAVVDLSLNSGLGDVSAYDKVIDTAVSQTFTLVQGENTEDSWLVTHRKSTDSFPAYKITAAGLTTKAVVSKTGSLADAKDYIFKDLKTSHDGKMIAGISYKDYTDIFALTYQFLEVFDFDAATGFLKTRVRTSVSGGYFFSSQTVEFSPDNRLVYGCYVSRVYGLQPCGFGSGNVVQYNLCYTDSAEFSKYSMSVASNFVFCGPDATWGRIQLGADKRIYMPYSGIFVSTINNPNRIGSACNFVFDSHRVEETNSGTVVAPTFHHRLIEKAVKNNIVYAGGCFPQPLSFGISNDTITNVQWNFGDAASGSNTSNAVAPQHSFSKPGIYTVTAKLFNSNGALIETLTELVEVKDPGKRLLADYPKDTAFCEGNTLKLKLNAVNGLFAWYTWSPWENKRLFVGTADSFYVSYSGTYYVEMRQNGCNGCVMVDSIKVNVLPVPYFNLGYDQNLCSGDSLQLKPYLTNTSYLWSTGETSESIWVRRGGTYWLEAEYDKNGCPRRDSIVITSVPGVQFSLPADTTLCNNQTLRLAPGVGNASYQWQDGSAAPAFTVTKPGTYWATVTNGNGCKKTDTVEVAYVNAQGIYLGRDTALCSGGSLLLSTNVANASYQWNTGDKTSSITVKQSGSYWVKVSNGACTVADTINVVFQSPPVVDLGRDTALCEKEKLVLRPGVSGANYLWSNNQTIDSLSVTGPGEYWLKLTKDGCTVVDTIRISYKSLPAVFLGQDTALCTGNRVLLAAANPFAVNYQWQDGSTQSTYWVQTEGLYWVKVKGENGCFNSDSISVKITPLPAFSLGEDTAVCQGQAVRYSFSLPGAAYQWSMGSTANNFTIQEPGTYWLEVSQAGCTKRDSVSVSFKPLPVIDLGNDTTLCEGTTLLLDAANAGASYRWNTGAFTPTYLVTQPGTYSVNVNIAGCVQEDAITVNYRYKPQFTLGADTALCNGQSFVLDPKIQTGQFTWQDGSATPTYLVQQPGTYALTVANDCGSLRDEIVVVNGVCQLYMPNTFTPNGDGKNDVFRVKYPQFIKTFRLQIFNRWGQKVFETTNAAGGWNGKAAGIPQPEGTYVWTIAMTDLNGKTATYKGSITLIR